MKQGLDDPAFYYEEGAVTGPRACVGGCIERNVDVVGNNIPGNPPESTNWITLTNSDILAFLK